MAYLTPFHAFLVIESFILNYAIAIIKFFELQTEYDFKKVIPHLWTTFIDIHSNTPKMWITKSFIHIAQSECVTFASCLQRQSQIFLEQYQKNHKRAHLDPLNQRPYAL